MGLKEMERLNNARQPPVWFHPFMETSFFDPCPKHPVVAAVTTSSRSTKISGCNFFCADCAGDALCSGACLADHAGHRLIQIRRSSSHTVVKVADLEHLLDVSFVQTYVYNGEAAVFLDTRGVPGKEKPGKIQCEECNWGLMDERYRFCSLRCKDDAIKYQLDFCVSFAVEKGSA